MKQQQIQCYRKEDKQYPDVFRQIHQSPDQVYIYGDLPNPDCPSVAIVGARNATPAGKAIARKFAYTLAKHGIQIISGFARGIDRAGHEGAMEAGGRTFAVLGNGVDICYPRENRDIYDKIFQMGGFISEFELGTTPTTRTFPMRNRLISALADITLVIEAREKSGSLITADYALEQGKEVYAVPGRIDEKISEGCNRLIAQGAAIALSPEEMLKDMQIQLRKIKTFREKDKFPLAQLEKTVYSCIRLQPKHIEELMSECRMSMDMMAQILMKLEMNDYIQEVSKNYYSRIV